MRPKSLSSFWGAFQFERGAFFDRCNGGTWFSMVSHSKPDPQQFIPFHFQILRQRRSHETHKMNICPFGHRSLILYDPDRILIPICIFSRRIAHDLHKGIRTILRIGKVIPECKINLVRNHIAVSVILGPAIRDRISKPDILQSACIVAVICSVKEKGKIRSAPYNNKNPLSYCKNHKNWPF